MSEDWNPACRSADGRSRATPTRQPPENLVPHRGSVATPSLSLARPQAGDQADAAARDARRKGRVALHLRAGVTGHRNIDEHDPLLAEAIRDVLDLLRSRCRPGTAATPVNLVVVSALAEGADRMVAREAMARGAGLEVVLPLPSEDYLTDFESGTSRSEFCGLLGQASAVTELAASGTRDQAYERAGLGYRRSVRRAARALGRPGRTRPGRDG